MIDANRIRQMLARFDRRTDIAPVGPPPAPISDAEIDALQDRIGIPVPEGLREWLKIANGAFVGTVAAYGAHPTDCPSSLEEVLEIYPLWRDRKWIPVADDGCGNYYVMPTQGEFGEGFPIVFIEAVTDYETPRYIVASDLAHFLVFLIEEELALMNIDPVEISERPQAWPFDKQIVVHDDPAILNFHGVPLPWEVDELNKGAI